MVSPFTIFPSPPFDWWEDIFSFHGHDHFPVDYHPVDRSKAKWSKEGHQNLASIFEDNDLPEHSLRSDQTTISPRCSLDLRHSDTDEEMDPWTTPTPPPSPESHDKSIIQKLREKLGFKESLQERLLNVENLVIGEHQMISLYPNESLHLPALKTICWHGGYTSHDSDPDQNVKSWRTRHEMENIRRQALYRILRAAVNLQSIRDFHFQNDFDLVIATKKVHCIHHLYLDDTVNVDHLLEFVENQPQVTVLQLVDRGLRPSKPAKWEVERRQKMALIIKFLFLSSRNSLKILDLDHFCTFFDIQIPHPLENLKQLTIGNSNFSRGPSRVLPRRICLNLTFPNLQVLDCRNLESDQNEYWDLYFPSNDKKDFVGTFDSVKILVISDNFSHFFMEKIGKLCPNFGVVVVDSHGHDNSLEFMMVKIFRYWTHLEGLEIRIRDFPTPHSLSLDSMMTGFHEETCERLRALGPRACPLSEFADENKSTIASLTKLKTLEIILGHESLHKFAHPDEILDEEQRPLMSFVTERFGFGHLPSLRVILTFDHNCPWGKELKKRLDFLVYPFVTLRHKKDCSCVCKPTAA